MMKKTLSTPPAAAPVPATQPPAPETAPALDRLRVWVGDKLPAEEEKALRAQLLEQIMQSLPKMSTSSIQQVARFMDLVENDRGCVTPVEEFITNLVMQHYDFGGLTPEEVMDEFEGPEGFKINYEECVEAAARFNAAYTQRATAA